MAKNPFKLKNITTTAKNVLLGGVGSAVVDLAWENIPQVAQYNEYKDGIKVVLGAVVGSMFEPKSKYGWARTMADGVATVGAASLVESLIEKYAPASAATEGLPEGTIGRMPRYGSRAFRRAAAGRRVAGLEDFQGA